MANTAPKHFFNTNAVGRFVSGSLTEQRKQDIDGRPIAEEDRRTEIGIAFKKTDPDMTRIFGEMNIYLGAQWATDQAKLTALAGWFQTMDGLSLKISDGDKANSKGKFNDNSKDCYVFWFSTPFDFKTVDPHNQELPAEAIKRGWHVQIAGDFTDNQQPWTISRNRCGMYLNFSVVRLVAEDDEIKSGISAEEAFGGSVAPTNLPSGARAVGTDVGMPGMAPSQQAGAAPEMPGQQAVPTAQPSTPGQPPTAAVTASPSNITPHNGILTPQTTPSQQTGAAPEMPDIPF